MPIVLSLLLLAGAAAVADPPLRLNEILYDPDGPDGDAEYVELHNSGAVPLPLDGFELHFVNGSDPDPPDVVWRAPTGRDVAPGGFFVVGGTAVGPRDDTARLGLQNGPDALVLVLDGRRVDAVAWGEEAAPWGEGAPAEDVSGRPLGRVPDGHDTDDNRRDFVPLDAPTPGRVNLPAVRIDPVEVQLQPPWRADPGPVGLSSVYVARGWGAVQEATVDWAGETLPLALARGDSLRVEREVQLRHGSNLLVVAGTHGEVELVARAGVDDLRLTEVQVRPGPDEPEWAELEVIARSGVAPAAWSIADASGSLRGLGGDLQLAVGQRFVLTADSAAFRRAHPEVEAPVLRPHGGWPTLNDGAGPGETADVLTLHDEEGVVVDRVAWTSDDLRERGRSLQRTDAVRDGRVLWIPSVAGATPGRGHPAETTGPRTDGLRLRPESFSPDGDGVDDVLQVVAPSAPGVITAEIRDLSGVLVADLEGIVADDRSHWQWDGRDAADRPVPAGAYVVLVRAEADTGGVKVWRALVAVDPRR